MARHRKPGSPKENKEEQYILNSCATTQRPLNKKGEYLFCQSPVYEKAITLNSPAANPLRIVATVQSRVALTGPGMLMRLPHLEAMGPQSQRHPALTGVAPKQHWANAAWHVRGRCTVPDKPPRITAGMTVSYLATHESLIHLFFFLRAFIGPVNWQLLSGTFL